VTLHPQDEPPTKQHRLSFTGIFSADPDFATRSAEVLRRELGEANTTAPAPPAHHAGQDRRSE
jgi:hypothetical protein